MRAIGIIPARMESTRFPGKPLAPIAGYPMLWHVCLAAHRARLFQSYYVATDSPEILKACRSWEVPAIPTASTCRSGTERCHDAMRQLAQRDEDIIVNIQGDEPMIRPESLDALVRTFTDPEVRIASLYFKPSTADFTADRNRVKVLVDGRHDATLFSRSVHQAQLWRVYGQHVGVYAYRRDVLAEIVTLPPNPSLEQGAWMEAGYKIRMVEVDHETVAVDRPEDAAEVERRMKG